MNVFIHIDRLVFEGLTPGARERASFAADLERALTRLLDTPGVNQHHAADKRTTTAAFQSRKLASGTAMDGLVQDVALAIAHARHK